MVRRKFLKTTLAIAAAPLSARAMRRTAPRPYRRIRPLYVREIKRPGPWAG
jgi:hypothetical protein